MFIFSNETIIKATALRRHHLYVTIYMTWMKLIIIEAIPYFTIFTLNVAIIRQILSSSSFRSRFTRKENNEVEMHAHCIENTSKRSHFLGTNVNGTFWIFQTEI